MPVQAHRSRTRKGVPLIRTPRYGHHPMRRSLLLLAALACVLVPAATASRSGKGNTAAQDIAWFNAQRAANGIPAGITENTDWSAKCDKHITFLEKAGGSLRHEEEPSSPFYTDDGEWGGTHSVLSQGDSWGADYNPWETAPIHLAQLMDPQISEMGIADRDGYVCATTWPGYERTPPDTTSVVTYPGNNTTIYASENPAESPFTPEDIVGLSRETGPNLYAYIWGPVLSDYSQSFQISVAAATLAGPEGAVPVKWVDHTTAKIGPYLPEASGILMPVHPLKPGSSYQASVTFSDGTHYSWTFKTAMLDNSIFIKAGAVIVRSKRGYRPMRAVQVISTAPNLTVTATFHGRPATLHWTGKGATRQATGAQVKHGLKVCAVSGGGDSGYQPAQACRTL